MFEGWRQCGSVFFFNIILERILGKMVVKLLRLDEFRCNVLSRRLNRYHRLEGITQLVGLLRVLVCKFQKNSWVSSVLPQQPCLINLGETKVSDMVKVCSFTAHVGVVDDRFAPHAPAVVLVGPHAKLVGRVGLQVVDDRVAGGAGLIDPLPVPLSVADGVEPGARWRQRKVEAMIKSWWRTRWWMDLKGKHASKHVPQGSTLAPLAFRLCATICVALTL